MTEPIDGNTYRNMVLAGANQVISGQDYLNKINVFPVPDSDTGTNMAYTMASISEGLSTFDSSEINQIGNKIAELAIDGARGNSGSILAQFFVGLAEGMKNKTQITVFEFAEIALLAKQYAHDAISVPREGTILDVISAWANSFHLHRTKVSRWNEMMSLCLEHSRVSLKETQRKLKELESAGVVDAGAQGFIYLVEGMLHFLNTGKIPEAQKINTLNPEIKSFTFNEKYRFCTECILIGKNIDKNNLRSKLLQFGDNLVIAGTADKIKIHLHTDNPKEVMQFCESFGALSDIKADDMIAQQKNAHMKHADIAIVVDSGCDLTPALLEKKNIHVVPVKLNFGNDHFVDKITIHLDDFWKLIETHPHHPQTSQPSVGDFKRKYQLLSSHYESIVSIHIPAIASGTFQSALSAAKKIEGLRIHVADSLSGSGGIGLIAIAAAEAANAGKSYDEVIKTVEDAKQKTQLFIGMDTLEFGVRGGRVPKLVKSIAKLFKVNPILTIRKSGKPRIAGVTLGTGDKHEKFKKFVLKKMKTHQAYRVFITHSRIEEKATQFSEEFSEKYGIENVFMCEMGPALSVHAGPKAICIAIQEI